MVALDGSEGAQKAFDMCTRLAKPKDLVFLITVLQGDNSPTAKDQANNMIISYETVLQEKGIPFEGIILEASTDPREGILDAVERYNINVLVVGTRGLSKIKRLFMGSVSSYCVQNSPCDVLVAK